MSSIPRGLADALWQARAVPPMSEVMSIDPVTLLRAYAMGVFPMSDDRAAHDVFWVEPKKRAVMPLTGFHLSRTLSKTIRQETFSVTANRAFPDVLKLCAQSAPDRPTTWINQPIEQSYIHLHALGFGHSVECWRDGELVGGLYGVALGRAFFGESMFSRATDASKVALAWLVARLRFAEFALLDCQFMTGHLRSLGALEITQRAYRSLLSAAVAEVPLGDVDALLGGAGDEPASLAFAPLSGELPPADRALLSPVRSVSGPNSGHSIVQLLTQTS